MYYLTYQPAKDAKPVGRFAHMNDVIHHVEIGNVAVTDLVIVKHNDKYITTTAGRVIFNSILPSEVQFTPETDVKLTGK